MRPRGHTDTTSVVRLAARRRGGALLAWTSAPRRYSFPGSTRGVQRRGDFPSAPARRVALDNVVRRVPQSDRLLHGRLRRRQSALPGRSSVNGPSTKVSPGERRARDTSGSTISRQTAGPAPCESGAALRGAVRPDPHRGTERQRPLPLRPPKDPGSLSLRRAGRRRKRASGARPRASVRSAHPPRGRADRRRSRGMRRASSERRQAAGDPGGRRGR